MIQPGLERIARLLKDVQFPWKAIHVAGTNGKGSICGYASALLTRRIIRNGRFVSPHLIDRWDCITINDKPVEEREFLKVEDHFRQINQREGINASEFELLTATAFELFNTKKVEIGVIEVGMGGKLDATNILNNQIVSVISMVARDHQNFLGNTLEDIALHKAGILRPKTPFIVNPMNEWNVHNVIDRYAEEIGAGPRIMPDTAALRQEVYSTKDWHTFADPLLPFQRDNAVLAFLAFLEVLRSRNGSMRYATSLLPHLKNKQLKGRLDTYRLAPIQDGKSAVLVDGAHNANAAEALQKYVFKNLQTKEHKDGELPPRAGWPVTWVLAMSDGKDAIGFLRALLRPGDNVITTTFGPVDGMPWVKPMDPRKLLHIAEEAHDSITGLCIPTRGTFRALCAAKYLARKNPIVLTGSLYLVGDYMRERRGIETDPSLDMKRIDQQERNRVNNFLSQKLEEQNQETQIGPTETATATEAETESIIDVEKRKLQEEIRRLDQEMEFLQLEENRLARAHLSDSNLPLSSAKLKGPATSIPFFDSEGEQNHSSQKRFDHVEDIRKRLEEFRAAPAPALPQLEPTPQNDLRTMVMQVPLRSDPESLLRGEGKPRIRAHYAADSQGETPNARLYRVPPAENFRRVTARGEQSLVRNVRPLKLGFYGAKSEETEEPLHDRKHIEGERPSKLYPKKLR